MVADTTVSTKSLLGNYDSSESLIATVVGDTITIKRNTMQSMFGLWMLLVIGAGVPLFLAASGKSIGGMIVVAVGCFLLFLALRSRLRHCTPAMVLASEAIEVRQGANVTKSIPYSELAEVAIVTGKRPLGASAIWTAAAYSLNVTKNSGELVTLFTIPDEKQASLVQEEIIKRIRR